eukprot:965855-Rhodomonas_salina.3
MVLRSSPTRRSLFRYAATRRASYGVCGTETEYPTTPCAVLKQRSRLPEMSCPVLAYHAIATPQY